MKKFFVLFLPLMLCFGCKSESDKKEVWIYASLYKDVIADIEPKLKIAFPDIDIQFYQAGSEDITAKVNAEILAGGTKADILIFSDRFWFEEATQKGKLHAYKPKGSQSVPELLKNREGYYSAVSLPLMVMVYNSEAIPDKDAPKTFKEMSDPKWKNKFATGSPLSSGTNFTTVAFLQKAYGWDYFKALRKNETISEGGNSSVIRRVQTKERPVGWVLLENALRFQDSDPKMKIIYPEDGAIVQTNVLAITKKEGDRSPAERVADWFYSKDGQDAMIKAYMYAAVPGYPPPKGAKALEEVLKTAPKWTPETLQEIMKDREKIKEEFTQIMFQ
jgi:iron(III) transport system substrate-binding protein